MTLLVYWSLAFVIDGISQTPVVLDASGKGTLSLTTLAVGSHTFGVNYFGSTNFVAFSTPAGSMLSHFVNKASTTVIVSLGMSPTPFTIVFFSVSENCLPSALPMRACSMVSP